MILPSEAEWEKAARGGLEIPVEPLIKSIQEINFNSSPNFESRQNELDKRRYPWDDEPDPNRANYDDTKIGTTSAVGCFPAGQSPYGCEEMSGNVWEWTRSLWGKDWEKSDFRYPYQPKDGREQLDAPDDVLRVLRGGAFSHDLRYVRCAFRHWYDPGDGDDLIGFRGVVSPSRF